MTALTAPRPVHSLETGFNPFRTFKVKADVRIYPGAIVAINAAGYLVPATAATNLRVVGIASPKRQQLKPLTGYVDTTGLADGAVECEVVTCIANAANSAGGDALTQADVGNVCFAADDQTVARTDGGTSQVTRGDVVFNGTDLVGVTVDGLTIDVPSNTSDDQTATDLVAKWNNHPLAKTIASATIDTSGDESWFVLAFKDSAAHTVLPYSPATADVVTISNTTAPVAATRSKAGKVWLVDASGVWITVGFDFGFPA